MKWLREKGRLCYASNVASHGGKSPRGSCEQIRKEDKYECRISPFSGCDASRGSFFSAEPRSRTARSITPFRFVGSCLLEGVPHRHDATSHALPDSPTLAAPFSSRAPVARERMEMGCAARSLATIASQSPRRTPMLCLFVFLFVKFGSAALSELGVMERIFQRYAASGVNVFEGCLEPT